MSGVARPRGPLPSRVYWTRRAVVLGVAFLLVFGFARVLGGGSDAKSDRGDTAEQAAGEQTAGELAPTLTPASTRTPKAANPKKKKPVLAQPDGPCDPADITIKATVVKEPNDGDIRIPLALTGTEAACTWSASSRSMVVKIISGDDRIWSSQQCPRLPQESVVVRSAVATKVVFVWNGRRSDTDCTSDSAGFALPGSYHVISAALGGEPTDVQFLLTRPPTERVTVTPKPKQTTKKKARTGATEPN
jgi:hypothetical protein